jgi:hypothetical protein
MLICIIFKLQIGANNARSDDTSRLKVAIADWLNSRAENHSELNMMPMRLSSRGKEDRGTSHDVTGHLLCPIEYDWDDLE